jgi:hypothetical protein
MTVGSVKSELRDAMKAVPSLSVLSIMWFIVLRYALTRMRIFNEVSAIDREAIGSVLALPLALITYFLGNFWDDHVFDPLYTEDPHRNFRRKWLESSRRNCLGLFPEGRGLDQARKRKAEALKLPTTEGVYAATERQIQGTRRGKTAERLLFLSKLCRAMIWPSSLVATGLISQVVYVVLREHRVAVASLIDGLLAWLFGMLLFVPYINLRVEHMLEMYRTGSARRRQGISREK